LCSFGHRKIAFVSPGLEPRNKMNLGVLQGLKESLHEKNIPVDQLQTVLPWDKEEISYLLESKDGPKAFVCFGDFWVKTIYEIALSKGLKIPEDISLVGYFDTPWCDKLDPKLTSVSIEPDKIADLAINTVVKGRSSEKIILPPRLIIRDSCSRV